MENRIVSILINLDGDIIVTYADGTTQNLGPADGLDPESILAQCQAAQAAAAEAASAAVAAVESIPADYSQLASDVEDLKTDVAGVETALESKADADDLDVLAADITELSENKADKTGVYDGLTAGVALQLAANAGTINTVPYVRRTSGGGARVGTYEKLQKIIGASIVWNQMVSNGDFATGDFTGWTKSTGSVTVISDGKCRFTTTTTSNRTHAILQDITLVSGRKYFCVATIKNLMSASGTFGMKYLSSSYVNAAVAELAPGETKQISGVFSPGAAANKFAVGISANLTAQDVFEASHIMLIDITECFGPAGADYLYALDAASAGSGAAIVRGMFPADYYETATAIIKSITGLEKHLMMDGQTMIGEYPLDSSLTLRGIMAVVAGSLTFDGDYYLPDGSVVRRYGERDYQSGDELLENALTDGTTTVYKLAETSEEAARPYQEIETVTGEGTESFVYTSGSFAVPVGHETFYPEDLTEKIEGLPWNFSLIIAPTESGYTAGRPYVSGDLFIVDNILYKAVASIASGATITPGTNCTATTVAAEIKSLQ